MLNLLFLVLFALSSLAADKPSENYTFMGVTLGFDEDNSEGGQVITAKWFVNESQTELMKIEDKTKKTVRKIDLRKTALTGDIVKVAETEGVFDIMDTCVIATKLGESDYRLYRSQAGNDFSEYREVDDKDKRITSVEDMKTYIFWGVTRPRVFIEITDDNGKKTILDDEYADKWIPVTK